MTTNEHVDRQKQQQNQHASSMTLRRSSQSLGIELTNDDCHDPDLVEADGLHRTEEGMMANGHFEGGHGTTASSTTTPETTAWDAWIQLTKAYIGPGCLSLPWAISQLDIPFGCTAIMIVAVWTSYNAWNVVALKRVIVKERLAQRESLRQTQSTDNHHHHHHHHTHNAHIQVTYADVGEWAYNEEMKDILLVSICVQQLAVCTVFLSFVGENIAAVMERTLTAEGEKAPSHAFVITLALPFVLLLSCIPNLKRLSPVMLVATVALFVGFGLLGVVIVTEWNHQPTPEEVNLYDIHWMKMPMAVCAILYSYEGICVVLPIESAMAQPKHFKKVFVSSMSFAAVVFSTIAALCVLAFGSVTNGSVTAYLVEKWDDENVKWWLYMTNAFCSLAVLLTYPLHLFPCFELIGPWLTRVLRLDLGTHALVSRSSIPDSRVFSPVTTCDNPDDGIVGNHDYHDAEQISSTTAHTAAERPLNNETATSAAEEEDATQQDTNSTDETDSVIELGDTIPFLAAFPTPGDSPQLRAILVCFTYIMAIAIPNVQLLVSLAGALSGSATALIIPPLLELAYVQRLEDQLYRSITDPDYEDDDDDDDPDEYDSENMNTANPGRSTTSPLQTRSSLVWKRRECYFLCGLGVVVGVFGTVAALLNIIKVYMGR